MGGVQKVDILPDAFGNKISPTVVGSSDGKTLVTDFAAVGLIGRGCALEGSKYLLGLTAQDDGVSAEVQQILDKVNRPGGAVCALEGRDDCLGRFATCTCECEQKCKPPQCSMQDPGVSLFLCDPCDLLPVCSSYHP